MKTVNEIESMIEHAMRLEGTLSGVEETHRDSVRDVLEWVLGQGDHPFLDIDPDVTA